MKLIEKITCREAVNEHGIQYRERFHPVIWAIMAAASGCRIRYMRRVELENGPYIFAVNHSNGYDIPLMARIIGKSFFVLASDEPKGDIPGLGLWLNGVIWSNRASREDKAHAKQLCIACLRYRKDLLIFPEGTWNLTEASPMLPMSWGVIEMAQATGSAIIPVALEYEKRTCTVNMGDPYFPVDSDKAAACAELRDKLAALRWELWERKGVYRRDSVSREDYTAYTGVRVKQYGLLTEQQLRAWVLERDPAPRDVFAHLKELKISGNNVFLLRENPYAENFFQENKHSETPDHAGSLP